MLGPRGMPPEAFQWLANATRNIVQSPEFRTQLSDRGIDAAYGSSVDLAALIDSEATRWRKLIEDRDLKLN